MTLPKGRVVPVDTERGKRGSRFKVACIGCKSRKVRCDKVLPACSTCRRRHQRCEYPTSSRLAKISVEEADILQEAERLETIKRYYGSPSVNTLLKDAEAATKFVNEDHDIQGGDTLESYKDYFDQAVFESVFATHRLDTSKKILDFKESNQLPEIYPNVMNFDLLLKELEGEAPITDVNTVMLIYSTLLVSATPGEDQSLLDNLEKDLKSLLLNTPDSVAKVRSWLFLIEYCYKRTRLEGAWKHLYQVTCVAYTLGIHKDRDEFPLWRSLVFYDTVISATTGRPTSIIEPYLNDEDPFNAYRYEDSIFLVIRQMRNVSIELLDSAENEEYSNKFWKVESNTVRCLTAIENRLAFKDYSIYSEVSLKTFRFLLVHSLIRLYYPYLESDSDILHRFRWKLNDFLLLFREFIISQKSNITNFRSQFPFVYCFCFQTFIVLLACYFRKVYKFDYHGLHTMESFQKCYEAVLEIPSLLNEKSLMDILHSTERLRRQREHKDKTKEKEPGPSDQQIQAPGGSNGAEEFNIPDLMKLSDDDLDNFLAGDPYSLESLESFLV